MTATPGAPRQPAQLQAVVEAIREGYRPERFILFGSFAWGHPTPDSDVDLLIIKDTEEPSQERLRKVRWAVQGRKKGLPLDILVLTLRAVGTASRRRRPLPGAHPVLHAA